MHNPNPQPQPKSDPNREDPSRGGWAEVAERQRRWRVLLESGRVRAKAKASPLGLGLCTGDSPERLERRRLATGVGASDGHHSCLSRDANVDGHWLHTRARDPLLRFAAQPPLPPMTK